MASTATTRGKYRKQGLGDGLNTWGLNSGLNGLFDVMDEAIHGVREITLTGTSYSLTSTNYTSNDIRFRQFKFTGNFAATITIPATQNWWVIENATGQTLTFSNGSNNATLGNAFFGLLVTNGTTVTMLTLPDGVNAKTVADNIASVNSIAANLASIQAVGSVTSEIALLGTTDAIADMNTLGTADVVADMNSLATTDVLADMAALAETDVLADMALLATTDVVSDMNTLAQADVVSDMNTLATADIVADMNLLASADVISDMNTLAQADVIADMNTLATADIVADMNTLATTDVVNDMNTLATTDVVNDMNVLGTPQNVTNMNTLAGMSSDITAVNAISSDITAVNTNPFKQSIIDVDNNSTNITNVGGSIASINTVANNLTDVNAFGNTYQISTNNPTTDGGGNALSPGDLSYVTSASKLRVYNGSSWEDAGSATNATVDRHSYVATANQTTFPATGSISYNPNFVDVYLNGVKLVNGTDVTVSSGNNIVLATGAAVNDTVDVVAYGTFALADMYTKAQSDNRYYQNPAVADLDMGATASISNGVLRVKNQGSQSQLALYCEVNNAHAVILQSPTHASFSGNVTLTLPPNTGTVGQLLTTDGNGVMTWANAPAGSSIATTLKFA